MSKASHKKHEAKKHNNQHQHAQKVVHIPEDDVFTQHRFGSEVLIGLIIFALGLFFMVPLYSASTVVLQFVLLAVFMLAVFAFIVVHWRKLKQQKNHPEMPLVERFMYLSVVSILAIAITIQALTRTLDLWLVAILVIVVLLKVLLTSRLSGK
ncbi:hypothetical protein H0W80_03505 [Candidatus Saccharibacteria bacterium]|nr:hypothetical protein [Candidatus Saccharibacteria bacterium]